MIKSKLAIITLLGIVPILISSNSSTNSNAKENTSTIVNDKIEVDITDINSTTENESMTKVQTLDASKASEFVENLRSGEKLSSFFNDKWIFIYHEDNRCDGSTDSASLSWD